MDKFCITLAFSFLFMAPSFYFESRYMGFVMGAINFAARASTIAAPMVAETGDKVPMAAVMTLCTLAAVGTLGLKKRGEADDRDDKNSD